MGGEGGPVDVQLLAMGGREPYYVLTISGSDSSGGAGMQADNRAILAAGAFPLNVLTAVTLQTTSGVESVERMSAAFVRTQVRRILECYPVRAMKSGMLSSLEIVEALADVLAEYPELPYVLDPVMRSSGGQELLEADAVEILRSRLMPCAHLTTPNVDELSVLCNAGSARSPLEQAQELANRVGRHILLKGGHLGGELCEDGLVAPGGGLEWFSGERLDSSNVRGTGCVLSALIAARLARGDALSVAVGRAKEMLTQGIARQAGVRWAGSGPAFVG